MCDGFAAIRSLMGVRRGAAAAHPWRFSRLRRGGAAMSAVAGRWSLVPAAVPDIDRHDLAEAVAEQLLNRWGVLFRDLAVRDCLRLPWREIQWALRRLEDRGLIRGGRFVAGFSGEQYALPAAAEQLARVRKTPRIQEKVVVNATDPLNLVGLILPGETVPAVRTNRVVYIDAPRPLRLARLAARSGWTAADLAAREAAQWPAEKKMQCAAVRNCVGAINTPEHSR